MASLTERLPVRLIPEQPLIAPMRNNVIHNGCGHNFALRLTEGTQRMLLQEKSAGLTPAAVIPTGIRAAAPFIGVALSFIIFREIPGPMFFIALVIMITGTWLVNREQPE